MKELITATINRISETEPNVKYIDEDWGQLEYYSNHPPVKFPCILVDIDRADWSNQGRKIQEGNVVVSISIVMEKLGNTNPRAPENQRTTAGMIWTVISNIHKAVHGWSAGDRYSALMRIATRKISRDDGLRMFVVLYSCQVMDASAMEQSYNIMDPEVASEVFNTIPPSPSLDISLKQLQNNPTDMALPEINIEFIQSSPGGSKDLPGDNILTRDEEQILTSFDELLTSK